MIAALYLMLPLVLLGLLLARRYPGERQVLALSRRRPSRRLATPQARPWRSGRPALWSPHGGLLIAYALAVRPPPRPLILA